MSWSDPCSKCGYHRADCECAILKSHRTPTAEEFAKEYCDGAKWSND